MWKEKQVSNILSQLIYIRLNLAKIWKEQAVTSLSVNLLVVILLFYFFFFQIIFLVNVKYSPQSVLGWFQLLRAVAASESVWGHLSVEHPFKGMMCQSRPGACRCTEKKVFTYVFASSLTIDTQSHCQIKRLAA